MGNSGATVTGTFATGSVSGKATVGGLVGNHTGSISASYTNITVTGGRQAGGLVGSAQGSSGSVVNSYSTGRVRTDSRNAPAQGDNGQDVGGVVGRMDPVGFSGPTVRNIYSTAVVENTVNPTDTAGVVGLDRSRRH